MIAPKQLIKIFLFLIPLNGFSQEKLSIIDKSLLPVEFQYKGDFLICINWQDLLGSNYLILSQSKFIKPEIAIEASKKYQLMTYNGRTDTVYDIEADYREKELYAYHYVQKDDSIFLLWKILDFEKDCPYDLTLEYLTKKPVITDKDGDGICETWLIYWLGCRSDVSAINMKLIMHEGRNKYAIRGTRKIRYGSEPDQVDGGIMKKDDSFDKLPQVIVDFAVDLWAKYNNEN
jgi:hypothetical protein